MPVQSDPDVFETLPHGGRVHVIGAGPVGLLLTALLQSIEGFRVRLYEKRREYTRTRMVQLEPYLVADSVESYCTDHIDSENVGAVFDPAEIAEGLIFANASRSHMTDSLSVIPEAKRRDPDFLIANMIPTCISDDIEAAKVVNRRTLTRYTMLPNYRNYWKEAGYAEEMTAIENAVAEGRQSDIPVLMSDRWLADATLFGPVSQVRDGVAAWRESGVSTPILVPSSASGNQLKAVEEIFSAFA